MGENVVEMLEKEMNYSVELIDYSLDYSKDLKSQIDNINPLVLDPKSRITIIDRNGNVLADTSTYIDYEDNHSTREEISDAFEKGRGISKRYSRTLHKSLLYMAAYSEKGDCVVRLSIPYGGVDTYALAMLPALIIGMLAAFVIAFFAAKTLSKNITEPLDEISEELLKIQNNGQLISFKRYKYDEINNIVRSTEILSERIENQMQLLKEEKNKMDNILYNINEGLVLIDNNKRVVIINKAALEILDCKNNETGKDIIKYTQNLEISDGVSKIFETGQESCFDLTSNGKTYFVHISRVSIGAIIIFIDVTYERESQTIRQGFFSDASHELKTPITSINGYAELLTSGLPYSEEQKTEFLTRIKNEAKNMTGLINDILMISRMEANSESGSINRNNMSYTKMNSVIDDTLDIVEPLRKANNISIKCDCQEISMKADYNHMCQLVNNLIVNAIKYNKPGGKVYVSSKLKGNNYELIVKDTGIGIPIEYQKRVFERFFRVDKGRSRKMGGTGLGLAIVKHVVNFYKGSINLKSKANKGTEITVTIPYE